MCEHIGVSTVVYLHSVAYLHSLVLVLCSILAFSLLTQNKACRLEPV